ncbi:MAG: DNA adenine methylase [Bacilli bacterium]|jgi:methyltransferase
MKPFIKYPGGKLKEFPLVDKFKPALISRYFEPFVGGASIYLNINVLDSYINDKSEDLTHLYSFVKNQDKLFFSYLTKLDILWKQVEDINCENIELINVDNFNKYTKQSLKLKNNKFNSLEKDGIIISQKDKDELTLTARKTALYMCVRDMYNDQTINPHLHTACFYFIREYCYSSMFRFSKDGKFNVPYGGRSYNLKYMTSKIDQMKSNDIISYFKHTSIYNLDFEDFLNLFQLNENDFIFLDPPYDSEFSTYDNNSFDRNEQISLRDCMKNTKAKWMLIIKKTDFIYNLYKEFNIYEYDKNYLVSFKNRNAKDVKHLLITNYEIEV